MFKLNLPIYPHKDSDASIGIAVVRYTKPYDILYGKWLFIAYFGHYALALSSRRGIEFTKCFATGVGG